METSTNLRFTAESEELDCDGNIVKTTRTGSYPIEAITPDRIIESDLAGGDFSKFPSLHIDDSDKFMVLGRMFKVNSRSSFYSSLWFNNVKNVYSDPVEGRFRYVLLENGKICKRWEYVDAGKPIGNSRKRHAKKDEKQ